MSRNIDYRSLDPFRGPASDPQNHVIDEFIAGRLGRREFLRRGAVMGLSASAMGTILAACGSAKPKSSSTSSASAPAVQPSTSSTSSTAAAGKAGATIRVGIIGPSAQVNPLTVSDSGLVLVGQTGEYLCRPDAHLKLQPVLATKWTPNADGTVWTFNLREGVKFHDGRPMTADDVVYTFKINTDPKGSSAALSAFGGVLEPEGIRKVDDLTVEFHLKGPNGNFPYLVSSDNYNVIILPQNYDPTKWEKDFIGTGPFKLTSFQPKQSAAFARNEEYWGTKALPAATEFKFYSEQSALNLALQGGTEDVIAPLAFSGGQSIISQFNVINKRSSANRQISMRCDQKPFTDKRVRQAFGFAIDREAIKKGIYGGFADIGNDNPFAPVFAATDPSVPQRTQDLEKSKALLSAAGYGSGLSTTLTTENLPGLPALGQAIQADLKKVGVDLKLNVEDQSKYFGKAVFGQSDWLDSTVSMVDYGYRSVANVFLTAALQSDGIWNAAHFKNPTYDALVRQYVAAVDLQTQRTLAGKIQRLLLDETPILFPNFYNYLAATAKNVSGVQFTGLGQIFLQEGSKA
jgi:peptide/nickel transport system substrate-binding protein